MLIIIKCLLWFLLSVIVLFGTGLHATKPPITLLLLAFLGGSTIFLFGLTGTKVAQQKVLYGSHLISAIVKEDCYQFFKDVLGIYLLVNAISVCSSLLIRTEQPLAEADQLFMIQAHASFGHLIVVVLVSAMVLSAIAFIWSRSTLFMALTYPLKLNAPQKIKRLERLGFVLGSNI